MPYLAIKAKTKDEKELAFLEEMAENIGSNGYIILDENEDIELKVAESLDGGKIYSEQSKMCNHEMSKLINGNFNISDEGRGAPIKYLMHTLNDFTRARMRSEQYFINEHVFPVLVKYGYPLNGKQYIFKAFLDEQTHPENY